MRNGAWLWRDREKEWRASVLAVRRSAMCQLTRANADHANRKQSSALLKHEVAYALGQIGMPSSIGTLEKVLGDPEAHPMVRHEVCQQIRNSQSFVFL